MYLAGRRRQKIGLGVAAEFRYGRERRRVRRGPTLVVVSGLRSSSKLLQPTAAKVGDTTQERYI